MSDHPRVSTHRCCRWPGCAWCKGHGWFRRLEEPHLASIKSLEDKQTPAVVADKRRAESRSFPP